MKNVMVIRLQTGEDIIAEVSEENTNADLYSTPKIHDPSKTEDTKDQTHTKIRHLCPVCNKTFSRINRKMEG